MRRRRSRARALAAAVYLTIASSTAPAGEIRVTPRALSPSHAPGDQVLGIRLLGTVEIGPGKVDSLPLYGLSGLAWDEDERILYAVSDGGNLFHLEPVIRDGLLESVVVARAFPLLDARGKALRGSWRDAEGLDVEMARNGVSGDSRLVISFERHMRIARYTPQGKFVSTVALPETLRRADAYQSNNRGLESVAVVPEIGVVTAPELPLRGDPPATVPLVAMDGRRWNHELYPMSNGSMVALEALEDGSLIVLERGYGWLYLSVSVAIRHLAVLDGSEARTDPDTLVVLRSTAGWSIDNFEGLTRHRENRFFMVSDDNNRPTQKTLLVYFEVLGAPSATELREFEARQESIQ